MTEQSRPDTDERDEPGGTPSPGPDSLTQRPLSPGDDAATRAVPGAYDADEPERGRGKAVKPGN